MNEKLNAYHVHHLREHFRNCYNIQVCFPLSIEFFTIRISDRSFDRSKVTQNKINFVNNCPHWGLNSQSLDHQSHALPTELCRNLTEISEVSFLLFHAPLYMLFISRTNWAWLYKGLNDSHRQPNSDLAQLAERGADDLEVVSLNPTGGNFWWNLFCAVWLQICQIIWQKCFRFPYREKHDYCY